MGCVIWITGLSGSGKTTLAKAVIKELSIIEQKAILLDGDQLREVLGSEKNSSRNHSRTARLELAMIYSRLCKILAKQEINIVISTISMFKEVHLWNRENLLNYIEVYLKVPISELIKRDPKKIYKSFKEGKLKNIAGLDLEVDYPENPNILLEYNEEMSIKYCAKKILQVFKEKNKLP